MPGGAHARWSRAVLRLELAVCRIHMLYTGLRCVPDAMTSDMGMTEGVHPGASVDAGHRAAGHEDIALRLGRRRRLTLALLLCVFTMNFTDRQILAVLAEPIKSELRLSDTQLGLLYGLAFALLYTSAGIPIARLADRANRAWIVNGSLVLFSLMTAVSGLATSYWQLLAARIGVAIGEGGTNPPSHSMIADLYPAGRRGTAMAIFALGPHLGLLLGFMLGGWVAELMGWRAAFVLAGLLGLLLACVSIRFLRELPTRRWLADETTLAGQAPLRMVVRSICRGAAMRHLFAGAAVFSMAAYAVVGWLPSFLMRSHSLTMATAASVVALCLGLLGGAGTLLGGMLADRLGEREPAWRLRCVALALVIMAPAWAMIFLVTESGIALSLLLAGACLGFYLGPTFAMVQSLAEPATRATAAAILLLVMNVVGLGLGPVAVGVLSDVLTPELGSDSLRHALLLVPPLCLWAAYHYHAAAGAVAADLAARRGQG